jgi:hypothetical protein
VRRAPFWGRAIEAFSMEQSRPVLAWTGAAAALLLVALPLLMRQRPPAPPVEPATPIPMTRGPLDPSPPGRSETVTLWLEAAPVTVDPALAAALRSGLERRAGLALGEREAADLALRWLPGPGGATSLALVTREGSILWRRPAAGVPPGRQAAAWLRELAPYLRTSTGL